MKAIQNQIENAIGKINKKVAKKYAREEMIKEKELIKK
jgi:hypothetical protein